MQQLIQTLRALPVDIDVHSPEPNALASLSDRDLVRAVGLAIARPKLDRFNSFILHAPLELLARATLLPLVQPRQRLACRMRLALIAALYSGGDELEPRRLVFSAVEDAQTALVGALREGDPDTADAAVTALAGRISCRMLSVGLVDLIAPKLAAAAHAPLLLSALIDADAGYGELVVMLRASIRMLASRPEQRLSWVDQPRDESGPEDLWLALAQPRRVNVPTDFIAPTMLAVEADGLAAKLLGRATQRSQDHTARTLARIAALSMIQDDPDRAPYGWTHCLTLPQGLMSLSHYSAEPARLGRIAATFVLGFRATLGSVRLDQGFEPVGPISISNLAGYAAMHEDAHLAKYVVACLQARASDPSAGLLFATAAHRLVDWWREEAVIRLESGDA